MTRITIGVSAIGLALLFVAYGKGIGVAHGGNALSHMYWATAAMMVVMAGNALAIVHLARAQRLLRLMRDRCAERGVPFDDLD
jgi:hypothetical protein